ncbi:MAG: T9SS type A sorting domain-containing protein, partial [Bacteroidota bacterium]
NAGADGQVFFRYANINTEPPPFGNLYQYKAIPPVMAWRDSVSPNPPSNLRYEPIAAGGPAVLRWDIPAAASDGDTASRYVLYRLTTPTPDQSDFDNPANILSLSGETATTPPVPSSNGPWYYAISALDRNYNESEAGNVIHVAPPPSPVLAMPTDGASGLPQSIDLSWNASALSASYHLQISSDSAFASDFVLNESGLVDTVKTATGFAGQQLYFWRVGAANAGGTSEFSPFFSFTTGFPATPLLASPANFMDNVSVSPTIVWMSTQAADSYRLQLSLSSNFTTIALDTAGVQDTSVAVTELLGRRIYFWRVSASNEIGTSLWSEVWRFRTETPTTVLADNNIPLDFLLYQNYPNPFNAMTHIRFTLPEEGMTKLIVYDLLGREVALLVNEQLPPGRYEARFEADHAASGTYIYVLTSGPYRSAKKLILLK